MIQSNGEIEHMRNALKSDLLIERSTTRVDRVAQLNLSLHLKEARRALTFLALFIATIAPAGEGALADLPIVELESTCVNEPQPSGLSFSLDAQRRAHLFYFTPLNDLTHMMISELNGALQVDRQVVTQYLFGPPSLVHTRSVQTSFGVASCYTDIRGIPSGVHVYEVTSEGVISTVAIESTSMSRCDITSDGELLWVSAVVDGELKVARGAAQRDAEGAGGSGADSQVIGSAD